MDDPRVMAPAQGRLLRTLWLLSALFIAYGATIPFSFDRQPGAVAIRLAHIGQTTPWALQAADRLSVPDVVQNVLLFVPFGALGFLARRSNGWTAAMVRAGVVTTLAAMLSGAVEIVQLFTADRITSLTDLATNAAGAGLGAMAAWLFRGTAFATLGQLGRAGWLDVTSLYPVLVFLAVVTLSAWEPFDVTLDVGTVGHKVRLLMRDIWQYRGVDDEGVVLLQTALLAGALCTWLEALGSGSPALTAAALSFVLGIALEGSQALIAARQPGLADAIVRVVGGVVGPLLWTFVGAATKRRLHLPAVALGTAVGAGLQMLAPFQLADSYQRVQWVPFLNYYAYTTFDTVSHTVELTLLYLPLGFVAGQASGSRRFAMRRSAALALAIAVPFEYAQGWMAGRYADVTDVALSVAGASAGAWLATSGAAAFAALVEPIRPGTVRR